MKPIYATVYGTAISVVLVAPDALMICGALTLAYLLLSAICAPWEREFGADLFARRTEPIAECEDVTEADGEEQDTAAPDRSEQNERILEILRSKDK